MAEGGGRRQIGQYGLIGVLGRGATATVYRAHQARLGRDVALKVLHARDEGDGALRARFEREARTLAQLRHPNIVQVYDAGEEDGELYLVMELIEGTSLRQRLGAPWTPERALPLLGQVAAALDYAHARGVIHRDLKPANVLFGVARIVGGTAGLTRADAAIGTPEYMSPEQALAEPVGPAADLYALGVVAYELLTGELPFTADSPLALLNAHVAKPPPRADAVNLRLPAPAGDSLARALAKRPEERYASAAALVEALERTLLDRDAQATDATGAYRAVPPQATREVPRVEPPGGSIPPAGGRPGRGPLFLGALAAVLLVVGASAAVGLRGSAPGATVLPIVAASPSTAAAAPETATAVPATPTAAPATPTAAPTATTAPPSATPAVPSPTAAPAAAPAVPSPTSRRPLPLRMVTSRDGVSFADEKTLSEPQGVLVTAMPLPQGGVRLYASDPYTFELHAWKSTDFIRWTEEPVKVNRLTGGMLFGEVLTLPDGRQRLYYLPQTGPLRTLDVQTFHSAVSTDGLTFAEEGARFGGRGYIFPTAGRAQDGVYLLFSWYDPAEQLRFLGARSTDGGLGFGQVGYPGTGPNTTLAGSGKMSNYDGRLHIARSGEAITTYTLGDDGRWLADPGTRWKGDTRSHWGQIVKTSDGVYRLFYTALWFLTEAERPDWWPGRPQ